MPWHKPDQWHAVSDAGYAICFSRALGGAGWVYLAWAPERPDAAQHRRALRGKATPEEAAALGYRARYPRGHPVPQLRQFLGRYESPEQARQACLDHQQQQEGANNGSS